MNIKLVDEKFSDDFVLIHHGSRNYLPEKVGKIRNDWKKPSGGLWTSPIKSNYGWKEAATDMCIFHNIHRSFTLKMKMDSKLLIIDSFTDFRNAMLIYKAESQYPLNRVDNFASLDFERIARVFSAIWLTEKGQVQTRFSRPSLYTWDCESVVILDKDSVYQIS